MGPSVMLFTRWDGGHMKMMVDGEENGSMMKGTRRWQGEIKQDLVISS